MKGWKEVHFSELLEEPVRNGLYKSKEYHGYGTKIINMGELFAYPRLIDMAMKKIYLTEIEKNKYIVKDGDLIFARRSLTAEGAGKCSIIFNIKEDTVFESSIIRARPDTSKASPLFLFYFFSSRLGKYLLGSILRQVAVAGITGSDLSDLCFKVPPLPEQHAIAAVLSSLDDKIDLLHRQNATLEAMAEALFRQWFVVEAKEEWEEITIDEVIIFYDSQRIPLSQTERDKKRTGELYPYYGAAEIMDYINEYIFDGDYLLIAEDGTVRNELGFPILQRASGKFWVNNHTHIVRAKEPYTNDFIYIYLLKRNIDEIITGAVQPKISQGNLKKLKFFKYPNDLVLGYNNLMKPYFEKIRSNQSQIHTLERLRDTLLPKLMSGEVRVDY